MLEKGLKNIAILKGNETDYNQTARFSGYLRALKKADIEPIVRNIWSINEISVEAGRNTVYKYLVNNIEVEGIVCTTDILAVGAIGAIRDMGKSVPKDIMVAGFDDTYIASCYLPTITSVKQDVNHMARKAVDVLLRYIDGENVTNSHHIVPVQLVCRESTDD